MGKPVGSALARWPLAGEEQSGVKGKLRIGGQQKLQPSLLALGWHSFLLGSSGWNRAW